MSTKQFPIQRRTRVVVVALIIAVLVAVLISLSASSCCAIVVLHVTSVAHVAQALRQELVNIDACATISQDKLVSLAIREIGHVHQKAGVKRRVVGLLDAIEDVVRPLYGVS